MDSTPRIGVSSCLLGQKVRYDGGHQRDRFLTDTFGRFVTWVPVCPEAECGLGIPRPSMRLVGDPHSPRLVVTSTGQDHTKRMLDFSRKRVRQLAGEDLDGFIFKKNSPSSGMERVKVFDQKGMPHRVGTGLFARTFMDRFPLLPVEDEGRLHDVHLRENFIERIFCLARYRNQVAPRFSVAKLVRFHSAHKLQIMAHSPKHLRQMGQLVAGASSLSRAEARTGYEELLLAAMKLRATIPRNINVIQHMMGWVKKQLSPDQKAEMAEVLDRYREGLVPLIVPVTLMKHHVRVHDVEYLASQTYLSPHPAELKLRNHA